MIPELNYYRVSRLIETYCLEKCLSIIIVPCAGMKYSLTLSEIEKNIF